MVRSQPNILKEDEVLEKIKKLHVLKQGAEGKTQHLIELKCIHNKPLFTKLYSLEDQPTSQAEAYLNPGDWRNWKVSWILYLRP